MESPLTGPRLGGSEIHFEFADPAHTLDSVALYQEARRPRIGPEMEKVEGGWAATMPVPPVDRLEYLLILRHPSGHAEWTPDPANPRLADGPFGPKSVIELPGYAPPAWTLEPAAPTGSMTPIRVPSRALRRSIEIQLWSSAGHGPGHRLPLLVVNDGPEYARYAGLVAYLDHLVHKRLLPPHHIALLQPGQRNQEYSANPAYARALNAELLPAIERAVRIPADPRLRVCMGTSLGGLAMMYAHHRHPDLCGGLFLQSSSFFRSPVGDQTAGFAHYTRVRRFVDGLLVPDGGTGPPLPTILTCGVVEPNLDGNRAVRDSLLRQGYPIRLEEHRDAHNWTAWRDALDPGLGDLLRDVWQ